MRRAATLAVLLAAALALAGCAPRQARTEVRLQRFFGECDALYGRSTDVAAADGECGIMTTLINRFNAENTDIHVAVNVVAWPGYNQLSAQLAAGDPPDLVIMHQSVVPDFQSRGLLEPLDLLLRQGRVDPSDFTPAARQGVVHGGAIYGLPLDTIGPLYHVNTRLFAAAGLLRDGAPVLPRSPDELLSQARKFKQATGKPYLIQSQVNDPATYVRNVYTYLMAQDQTIFADRRHIRLNTPQAHALVQLFRTLNVEGLSTLNQDPSAAAGSFIRGEGGVFPTGTWLIGDFDREARTPGRPLYRSYAVTLYPRLYRGEAAFVDGHAWVAPRRARSPAQQAAIARFLAYFARNDLQWSRTGHLPAYASVVADPRFERLPHRAGIAGLPQIGRQLPGDVQRQSAIQDIVGDELGAAISGGKPASAALNDAERRVDDLLAQIP
jgi:multiple sugar transport system substrate-binding protein